MTRDKTGLSVLSPVIYPASLSKSGAKQRLWLQHLLVNKLGQLSWRISAGEIRRTKRVHDLIRC